MECEMEPTMRIEHLGMGNHVNNQTGNVAPGAPAAAQSRQDESARTGFDPAAVPASEAASRVMEASNPLQSANRVMEFTIDPESGKHVVKIMDSASRELIRQIPMEEALALARSLDQLKGLLLYAKA
jgi:flagellar protein FlaG